MTEADRLSGTDPISMLDFLSGKASDRKLRLFACACCRKIDWRDPSVEFLRTLEVSEQFADGATSKAALKRGRQGVRAVRHQLQAQDVKDPVKWTALWLAEVAASENAFAGVAREIQRLTTEGLLPASRQPPCDLLLRDVFGPLPFRSITLLPNWLASHVVALAQAIYDENAFGRLPELADALVDVGCDHEDIMNHCRSEGPHLRGCWVVDRVLGKV